MIGIVEHQCDDPVRLLNAYKRCTGTHLSGPSVTGAATFAFPVSSMTRTAQPGRLRRRLASLPRRDVVNLSRTYSRTEGTIPNRYDIHS
jgi:hypothetical protein